MGESRGEQENESNLASVICLSILQPKQEGNVLQLAAVLSGLVCFKKNGMTLATLGFSAKFKLVSLGGKSRGV